MIKKWGAKSVVSVLLVAASAALLKNDVWIFWTWWLLAAIMGMIGMPFTSRLFEGFEDKGWLFSKVLSIAVTGFATWFLVSVKLLKFSTFSCVAVCVGFALVNIFYLFFQTRKGVDCVPVNRFSLIWEEELLFFTAFLVWTYLAGFRPAAYGTEKFMDYGFMEAIMRSTDFPPKDIWYSQGNINYYYGGQYFAVFLTKLSGGTVAVTYNLMRTFVAGLAFSLPFSLVYQMITDGYKNKMEGKRKIIPHIFGLLAGGAVCIAGNMHYVIYAKVIPWIQALTGNQTGENYWFPNATRYIGYNPDVPDKTIHEFPCYSFVLGDLHAHVVNIMFVLLMIGILYGWMRERRTQKAIVEKLSVRQFWIRQLVMPHILTAAFLLGMFQWSNFWDYVIYFVVAGGVILFTNIIRLEGKVKKIILVTAAQAMEVLLVANIIILPFTLQFKTMVQGVALAQNHSMPHQLLILWGLPFFLTIVFIISLVWEKLRKLKRKNIYRLMKAISVPDLFAVIMGLCAIGLVLIPELVYVRDIYENGNARANTMFKLTYQAYIMFGMTMVYGAFRLLFICKNKILKVISLIGLFLLIWTFGYFGNSVHSWFGEVWNPEKYQGLNATAFLETDFPEDAAAIRWLRNNIEGTPVVLEANGDSYTGYERVSAMTGLPTVLGWYVHEWLWRNDVSDLNAKSQDVETIYTSQDSEQVRKLLETYKVSYIFVGSKEKEKYGEKLNHEVLQSLGEIVFQDASSGTYIIKVDQK